MHKYEELYKKASTNYESLSKFNGDPKQLLDSWGIIKGLNYPMTTSFQ
jgi:hypothetical protein